MGRGVRASVNRCTGIRRRRSAWYIAPLRGYGTLMERQRVSPWLATATAYAWRFLALAAAIGVALWVLGRLRVVVVPIPFALFFASLPSPIVGCSRLEGFRAVWWRPRPCC